jgi:chorismate--pyruvate lyase
MMHDLSSISLRLAHWHPHINSLACDAQWQSWLTHRASLTTRLQAHATSFRVQRVHQQRGRALLDELTPLALTKPCQVIERDVVLRCDERAVVYAHTILPLSANASQWPLFASLGERSLGTTLFSDPLVERGALWFARIKKQHPLMRRIQDLQLLEEDEQSYANASYLYARRSCFTRKGATLLVTEVFLPQVRQLRIRA